MSHLHLAAHSIVDVTLPERSFVQLVPGDGEDGRLQAREILNFNLEGTLVTLASCQSVGGRVVAGEGVLGMARSFLGAGATGVIGSLWPVDDAETAALMDRYYRNLSKGQRPVEALTAAKRARMRAGAPPSSWAAFILVGTGDRPIWPSQRAWPRWPATSALLLVAVWAAWRLRLRFRR